jgi:hypothetical protein
VRLAGVAVYCFGWMLAGAHAADIILKKPAKGVGDTSNSIPKTEDLQRFT